ncbi:MAG: DUF885 family protein [Saprospiraceae bacterium]|nr:DUF885 family protein [Saprospiraceae bacterium]
MFKLLWCFLLMFLVSPSLWSSSRAESACVSAGNYNDLLLFFQEWRSFETPPLRMGAPDYTEATFKKRLPIFKKLKSKLNSIDTSHWQVNQKVDWTIVQAELNGFDFNYRILKPWSRDPAFYVSVWTEQSDVPAHEGPTHHRTTELWKYTFPLTAEQKSKFQVDLKAIKPLNEQAKLNLNGNAKDLWIAGIRNIQNQTEDLKEILNLPGISEDENLVDIIHSAIESTNDLVVWLKKESLKKSGPSGIGKENYTWFLKNVLLVPMTWEDEVMLLKTQLSRAWATLKLEEHHNKLLPELNEVESNEAYSLLAKNAVKSLMTFLEKNDIITVKDYFGPALENHTGEFIPKDRRNFFAITAHFDPRPLFSHFYHWFELALMDKEPHSNPIRRKPLLYNIFISHNEGIATSVEEMFMHAGLYDDTPRAKEIVYIMIAQRAARGLGSLYAHANMMTMEEAGKVHSEYTPRGWMKTEKNLLLFEQQLYLRQPGYGTSYISGKYLMESAIADFARIKEQNHEEFKIKDFMDKLISMGNIPMACGLWEMTGSDKIFHDLK